MEEDMILDEMEESPAKIGGKYKSINELETYTIKCLLTSQILLSRYIDIMKPSYFEDATNKMLFKVIQGYYKEMGYKIPKDEVLLRLEDLLPTKPGMEDKSKTLRDNCKSLIERFFNEEEVNQESANRNIHNFIIKRVSEEALDGLINNVTGVSENKYEEAQYYAIEKCVAKIRESANISVDISEPFTLSDVKKIPEIKKEGLGEGTRIVKFFLNSLNDTMEYGGINVGAVACVMAPPGCFTGDTRIMTLDGKTETLENLYNQKSKNLECYSFNKEDRKIQIKTADSVYLSKYENELAEVEVDGKYKIKCTLDHPFLLRGKKSYTQAKDLKVGDSLEPIYRKEGSEKILEDAKRYNHMVTGIKFIHLEKAVPVYGLVEVHQNHNYAIALNNEEGIFVSNTGKTTFLTNQGLYSAKQGLNVCHIFLGDMEKYDALIRYYSVYKQSDYMKIEILNRDLEKKQSAYKRLLKRYKKGDKQYEYYSKKVEEIEIQLKSNRATDQMWKSKRNILTSKQLVSFTDEELQLIYQQDTEYLKIASHIDVNVYAVGDMSMDALRQAIYNWQESRKKHYDVIIIDYDSNLKQPADNMYESGGIIYDQAKNLAQVNKSVVFMASQPNKAYWKNEMIPLEACSESSKKQMIIDLLITIGRPEGCNTGIRKVFIPKNRRGKENEILHAKMEGDTGFMYEISQEDYDALKKQGYDPTLIISAGGMYGNAGKKKKDDTEKSQVTNAALPENMKQISL